MLGQNVQHPQVKVMKDFFFGSQFVEVAVYSQLAPGKDGIVKGKGRGELTHDMEAGKHRRRQASRLCLQ